MSERKKSYSYRGRHAELYDLFYKDKPYRDEASFVDRCINRFSDGKAKKMLELACGTGSHAMEFSSMGYDVVAVDYSEDMLARAKEKTRNSALNIDFRIQDMRELSLGESRFDVAVSLFDSIGYVATNDGLKKVFQGVRGHLRPGGLFIFEFWHAGAMLCDYEPVRVRRWPVKDGEVLRISETRLKVAEQLAEVTYSIYEFEGNDVCSTIIETQINRYFLVQEMALWLTENGFEPIKWFAGFKDDEHIDTSTWHVVAVSKCRER